MLESWENYSTIFGIVMLQGVNMRLPVPWLRDMVDEFINQYQYFCQYRSKLAGRTPQEIETLRANSNVWSTAEVLKTLNKLAEKSGIGEKLEAEFAGKTDAISNSETSADEESNVLTMLGYFGLLGLGRMHCLIGDYEAALRATDPARLAQKGALTALPSVHVDVYYHMGFAYMMCHRYCDAIRSLNALCAYVSRVQSAMAQKAGNSWEALAKTTEQAYAMLAMCLSLSPMLQYVEEGVMAQLREKQGEKMIKMNRMEEKSFDDLFGASCPKFVLAEPDYSELVNRNQDAYLNQLKIFMDEIRLFAGFHELRSQLALYTSISVPKLAKQMGMEDRALRPMLASYKERATAMQWSGEASNLSGTPSRCTDIDFEIGADDVIHVIQTSAKSSSSDSLKRNIIMLEDVTKRIEARALQV